jgi:hypothetical protein
MSHGEVTGYSFAPPDLSEVFLGVVGRTSLEEADGESPDTDAEPAGSTAATQGVQA